MRAPHGGRYGRPGGRPVEDVALAALDAFLASVDGLGDRVRWVTVRELAGEAERRWAPAR